MITHDRALELAAAAIDFPLTGADRQSLEAHLAGCSACRRSSAGFATDAGTIAILPAAALDDARADAILATILARRDRVPVMRYLAIAALLALLAVTSLVVGAELVRRLEAPPELISLPSRTLTAACGEPPTAVQDLLALGDAIAAACFGSRDLSVTGVVPIGTAIVDPCPGRSPAWLACGDGSRLFPSLDDSAPGVRYAHDGDVPVVEPPGAPPRTVLSSFWARITAHYHDPASESCAASAATDVLFDDPAGLVALCEQTLVVTAIERLASETVPQPVLNGRWTMIAGPEAFGPNAGTVLTSIAELDGRYYATSGTALDDLSTFHLWTSVDGVGWQEIDSGEFAPGFLASDGSRLIALSRWGGASDTRFSTDGRVWQPLGGMGEASQPTTILGGGTAIYAGGSEGVDAAIWHLAGDAWERATVENAAGWLGVQDASPAVVFRIANTTRGWLAIGQGPPDGGAGFPETRAWSSVDGMNWTAEDLPSVDGTMAVGGWGLWPEMEIVVGSSSPANGRMSAWVRSGEAWDVATFNGAHPGRLGPVFDANGVIVAVGFDNQSSVGGVLRSTAWGSMNGASWWPLPTDDLSNGLANDVFVTRQGRILAPGLRFDGAAVQGFESPSRPALYEFTLEGS